MWLTTVFSDLNTLKAASIEDVAFLALGQAKSDARRFHPGNILNGLAQSGHWSPTPTGTPSWADLDETQLILSEAFAWLESERLIVRDYSEVTGGWYKVTARGWSVRESHDLSSYAKRAYLPREILREEVAEVALSPFLAGRYDEAVRAAFTRLEVAVREAAGYGHDQYGVSMVREAFRPGAKNGSGGLGPLSDPALEFTEREAVAHLFAGAIGYIKNPLSHRELNIDDARLAASRILVANDLMNTLAAHAEKKAERAKRSTNRSVGE